MLIADDDDYVDVDDDDDVDDDADDDDDDDGGRIMVTICHSCRHPPFEGALGAPHSHCSLDYCLPIKKTTVYCLQKSKRVFLQCFIFLFLYNLLCSRIHTRIATLLFHQTAFSTE